LASEENQLTRLEALHLYTKGSAWVSNEETVKGTLEDGMYADFAILSDDYFSIPEKQINDLSSVLTVVGGNIVFGDEEFRSLSPKLPQVIPNWSPVKYFGGYQK
jgi:predicted amidohydrolase YtcJ